MGTRVGTDASVLALRELAGGAWELAAFGEDDLVSAASVMEKYRDHPIGLVDASNVVLAARYRTRTIATLDRRHFAVLRTLTGGHFRIVPWRLPR